MHNYYKGIEKIVEMRKRSDEMDYIGLINAGVTAQIEKLRQNEHKQAIETHTFKELHYLLSEEFIELVQELDKWTMNINDLRHEAADLSNICHALILKCDQELNK